MRIRVRELNDKTGELPAGALSLSLTVMGLFRNKSRCLGTAVTLVAALVPAILWVGDISWANDESELVSRAWHANHAHTLVRHGLEGNFSIVYGPLPAQIYQALLLFTGNPIHLAAIRAGLCAGVVALALLWLARSLEMPSWFAAAVVVAPHVWWFNRLVWDASFAIPIGSVALAAYAASLRQPRPAYLRMAFGCGLLLAFIHPQDLPVLAALLGHMLLFRRASLRQYWKGVALVVIAIAALNCFYIRDVTIMLAQRLGGSIRAGYPGADSRWPSFLAPLMGGRLLAGNAFSDWGRLQWLQETLSLVSEIVFPLIWLGMAATGWRWMQSLRGRAKEEPGSCEKLDAQKTAETLGRIALVALVLQSLLYGLMRVPAALQYFFGPFAVEVVLAWIGAQSLRRIPTLRALAVAMYGASCAAITIPALIQIHRDGYARASARPTLANQYQVARKLNQYNNTLALTDVPPFYSYNADARPLRCLRLFAPISQAPHHAAGQLVIRYASGPAGNDCRIELLDATLPQQIPTGAKPTFIGPPGGG